MELSMSMFATQADYWKARAELAEADAARFAWRYSGRETRSDALMNIELRILNGDQPTLDEVRAAYDECMATPLTPNAQVKRQERSDCPLEPVVSRRPTTK